ncbi:nucleotide exchange factor GrpE [Sporosarcina sp. ACRSM]|uniref:nucleotide exchange factor GrpE n=1 Tax=Sporosarcina sp. ACRSM TaxID=2918216 RepID=UPI001EF43F6B|nr:nucleotide exchange factor GrpE [Sporosarcina sp. ACRSM]MCG7336427.1 nucleotide exchange factor GrpE [Sporosarcina sp. ACRSM]
MTETKADLNDEEVVKNDSTAEETAVENENETMVEQQAAEADENSTAAEPETEIEELKAKLQDEENKYFRLLADYENFKRRATLDQEALQKYRAQSVVNNLIPVLDNFERALTVEAKTEEVKSMMTGMDMIYRTLVDALKAEGLVEIEALDKEFDPNFHQAIMTGTDEEKPSGVVLEELQKGYLLKDRVLRPSMVKVNE